VRRRRRNSSTTPARDINVGSLTELLAEFRRYSAPAFGGGADTWILRRRHAGVASGVTLTGAVAILHRDRGRGETMFISHTLRAVVLTAGVAGFAAAAAQADECETMTKTVQVLIDKMDPSAKGGDNPAKLCAAYGEGLGLIKSFRIVADECLDEGDERSQTLAKLDRSIRQLQSQVDKNCE
jgi:hypothetical protein